MSRLNFSDGFSIDTSGPYRITNGPDGLYVVGNGFMTAVETLQADAEPEGGADLVPFGEDRDEILDRGECPGREARVHNWSGWGPPHPYGVVLCSWARGETTVRIKVRACAFCYLIEVRPLESPWGG